jgi:outer membrane protein
VAQLKVLGDLTGTHEGFELSASYEIPYQIGRRTMGLAIGLNWRSKELVDYYYGVRAGEARNGRPTYAGRSATNASVGLTVDYKLNDHWHVLGGSEYVRLGDGITASPIIARNYEASVFSALLYRF